MDIKWRNYSHSVVAKVVAFIIVILCLTSSITIFANIEVLHNEDFDIVFEESYYQGKDYLSNCSEVIENIKKVQKYKSKENILNGGTLTENVIAEQEDRLFWDFQYNSKSYNPNLTPEENHKIFKEVYADKLVQAKNSQIKQDLNDFNMALQRLAGYEGLVYYAKNGETEFSNSTDKAKEYFKTFPAYMIFEGYENEVFPQEVNQNTRYYWLSSSTNNIEQQDAIYIAFTQDYLNPRIVEWQDNKLLITDSLYQIAALLIVLIVAFIYLIVVVGRKPYDNQVQLNFFSRIFNDFNLVMCILLVAIWAIVISESEQFKSLNLIFLITLFAASLSLLLVLSLVTHFKNRTLMKNTLIYKIFHRLFSFFRDIYNSGSVGLKVVLIVIGYPIIVAITFFMFPITLGAAAWIAHKKVKEFNAIKEGVKKVKDGDLHFSINASGDGEFAKLAADINSIADGLSKAVENEIKSERLKTELITNVSHDIRTPLTSIITYVDLLKHEKDQSKVDNYLEIIDQKSQRLKVLTEDLFEAAKASSGNIQVNLEAIDLMSLITQGLGELDDKIQESELDFKISHPKDRLVVKADGKLLWRAIENLLSNIFKYALQGSRVYIDVTNVGTVATLTIKNISAYELNISSDELMERFKRGDESRSSQGSGLGLSIAKSLLEIQRGSFNIEIDGDLFKAIIQMPLVQTN
ncbi:sensor histidine kinase [Desulfosporosinus meridiei]|uniref:histidine kinase n=1 Tax=Desulfosporosinus meridiei (strain ATCC BAA-275 / DSM 13257 / KCTC 12902 / NCIMB 13706 / S10) TaxID=768704 RepID=J7IL03_DESMD|nr:HAMP domain-containing sensor histidine kinase [Desulfosporosinus meridiei]AFQ42467.1 signal transduction histidine kinase [Desulfosporosinus meridiei DSM 13257]